MNTILVTLAFLLSLCLLLRAARSISRLLLRPVSTFAVHQEVTAEDYETYLSAMEASFDVPRPRSIRRSTPKTPRIPKVKTSNQNTASSSTAPQACAVAKQTPYSKAKASSAVEVETRSQARAALKAFLASRISTTDDRASIAQRFSVPLTESSQQQSPLTTISKARPPAFENPVAGIHEDRCSFMVVDSTKPSPRFLFLRQNSIRLVTRCLRMVSRAVLVVGFIAASFFTRRKKPPPTGATLQNRVE